MHKMHNSHHGSRRRQGQSDVTNRRRRQHLLPLIDLQPGQVAFQVVCHESAAGGVIGASGSTINRIRDETSCIVSFQEPKDGAEHRVIVVVGSSTPERRLVLEEGCEELVSNAQEALLRVVERMWQVYGHGRGGGRGGFCGLLASSAQIAVIVGKGGRTIVKLKKVSEAHINILPPPPCASPDEQLIQITGSVVSVKRAIILVTGYLQSFPQLNRYQMPMPVRPIERSSSSTTSHDQHLQFFPHLSSMLPSSDDTGSPLSNGSKEISKDDKQEVSFRLLVSASAAGCIIGKAGSVVKSMQNETGASILVAQSKTRSWERVVTVSAMEVSYLVLVFCVHGLFSFFFTHHVADYAYWGILLTSSLQWFSCRTRNRGTLLQRKLPF
ncbi:RNA-binding KH domain-containing protein RCF3 [Linum grandiflorum]